MVSPINTLREQIETAEAWLAEREPLFAGLIQEHGSCSLDSWQRGAFDTLVWAILGQQISVQAANAIEARLLQILGDQQFRAEAVQALDQQQLRAAGLSGAKIRTVTNLSNVVCSGELELTDLHTADTDEIKQQLCALPGIGPWTAEMFLIFGLQRLDVFSPGDLGLRKAIQQLFGLAERPSPEQSARQASAWQPYRTVASWHLWREVD